MESTWRTYPLCEGDFDGDDVEVVDESNEDDDISDLLRHLAAGLDELA